MGSLIQMQVEDGRLLCRSALVPGNGPETTGALPASVDTSGLIHRACEGRFCPPDRFLLARKAAALALKPGFDQLLALNAVQDVVPYPHQVHTVAVVLRQMRGRALLCDEVGLGKTVEAGLVLMEYLLRGLVRRVLILTPPSLMYQWQEEMAQKFNLDFVLSEAPEFKDAGAVAWSRFDHIIASLSHAKRGAQLESVQQAAFDMVIVDEAHYLRHRETRAWKLVNGLDKKYILLLTATPVQNDLEELFNLITLLKPGQLLTEGEFRKRFVVRGDRLRAQNVEELRQLVGQVMVRNRRSTVGIAFTQRRAHTVRVEATPAELHLRRLVTDLVRETYPALATGPELVPGDGSSEAIAERGERRTAGSAQGKLAAGLDRLTLKTLQMELGSSPAAVVPTVERLLSHTLPPGLAERLEGALGAARTTASTAKLSALVQTLASLPRGEKVLLFTRYQATLRWLRHNLVPWPTAVYYGALSAREKDEAVDQFRKDSQILLSTDVGGEGRNLQFCHLLINFDIPWNPMRIEQRIGRLSRIGQQRDVYIFNLASAGSIEDHLLEVLDRKINLFELVVGELDLILGRLEDERDLEDIVMELVATSSTDEEARQRIENLGERLKGLKGDYVRAQALDDTLFQGVGLEQPAG